MNNICNRVKGVGENIELENMLVVFYFCKNHKVQKRLKHIAVEYSLKVLKILGGGINYLRNKLEQNRQYV